jgi:hypothetical protein
MALASLLTSSGWGTGMDIGTAVSKKMDRSAKKSTLRGVRTQDSALFRDGWVPKFPSVSATFRGSRGLLRK